MNPQHQRPIIGISIGDLNGIGPEVVIKTFSDPRILELCTPVIFASNKLMNFYRKSVPDVNLNFQIIKDFTRITPKQLHMFQVLGGRKLRSHQVSLLKPVASTPLNHW